VPLGAALVTLLVLQPLQDEPSSVLQPHWRGRQRCCRHRRHNRCWRWLQQLQLLLLLLLRLLAVLAHVRLLCVLLPLLLLLLLVSVSRLLGKRLIRHNCCCCWRLLVWLHGLQLAPLHALLPALSHDRVGGWGGTMHQQHLGWQPPAISSEAPHSLSLGKRRPQAITLWQLSSSVHGGRWASSSGTDRSSGGCCLASSRVDVHGCW
jgi:hypothetical protein